MPFVTNIRVDRSLAPNADLESHPFDVPAVRSLFEGVELHPRCTYFVGENGIGKSTLLEALAVRWGFNPEGGSKNFHFGTYDSHSELNNAVRISKTATRPMDGFFLRAESFYNVATEIERLGPSILWSYGGKSLHEQSHGESFFSLFLHRFGGHGFYVLDEPEAALSPSRQLAFLVRLHDLIRDCSQFVIATHSPIVLAYPDAWIYQLTEDGIERIDYEQTEHYDLTRRFLEDRERMLHQLLNDDLL